MTKKVFPIYKGKNLARTEMGYNNEACARSRMDEMPIISDFRKMLPEDYWWEFQYVMKHKGTISGHIIGEPPDMHDPDYDTKVLVKDLTDKKVQKLYRRLFDITRKRYDEQSEAERKEVIKIGKELDKLGWFFRLGGCDTKDYDKKYRKYKKENLTFIKKDVEIIVKD